MLLACNGVKKAFGAQSVLEDVSFTIEEKQKAAIVGANGAGKTTLFKLITGEISPDSGEIAVKKGAVVGTLDQTPAFNPENTAYQEVLTAFAPLIDMERELRRLESQMAAQTGGALAAMMRKYDALSHTFERAGGFGFESRARGVINGLAFAKDECQPVGTFSGGQKTLLAMAKLLLSQNDLLLLDEPTNHLDMDATAWLEDFLRGYPGAVALISHDRYFINRVATTVIEIERGKAAVYTGDYSQYAVKKAARRQAALKSYKDQAKEIQRQEAIIQKLKSFNREKSVKRAESREKALAKVQRLEKPPEQGTVHMAFKPRRESGGDVLRVSRLAKSYGGSGLFSDVSFLLRKGEKMALVGPNGVGKTTLLRIILGRETPDSGAVQFGAGVLVGYYDQEHMNIDGAKNIFQVISDANPRLASSDIRDALAAFMFTGDDVFRAVATLSGGERGRVALASVMLGGPNLLILDEPTNHLDIFSKEVLEDAIKSYEGSVLFVSHDRYFMNATATDMLELTPGGVCRYMGGYDDMLEKKRAAAEPRAPGEAQSAPRPKTDWQREKEDAAAARKKQSALARAERAITETEADIAALDAEMSAPQNCANHERLAELYAKKAELCALLEKLYDEWQARCD